MQTASQTARLIWQDTWVVNRSSAGSMALDNKVDAALALHRFGLGPALAGGTIAAIESDPRGALLAELDRPGAGRIVNADLISSGEATRSAIAFQQAQRELRRGARKTAPKPGDQTGRADGPEAGPRGHHTTP